MAGGFILFHIILLIYCLINFSESASSNDCEKSMKRNYNKWSTEEEKNLIYFDVVTDDGRGNQLGRIKALWHETYPGSNVTDVALRRKLQRIRQESQKEDERKRLFKWDHKRKTELLDVYHTTKPYKEDAERTLEEEWSRRYEDCQLSHKGLVKRVKKILRERGKKPEHVEEGTSNTDFKWDKQHDSDLVHAYKVAHLEREAPLKNIYQMWSDLHPECIFVTRGQLRERVAYLKTNPPDDYFPWTKEENEELLDIYDRTMPDEEDQGQRIYDIWSKIHPRYKFMTPYYLQMHAGTLAHEREMQRSGGSTRRQWTHEEKADLVILYRRHLGKSPRDFGFYKEWLRKHPRLAHLGSAHLKKYAQLLDYRGFNPATKKLGRGSPRQNDNTYSSQKNEEQRGWYDKILSKKRIHSKRLMERYEGERKADTPLKFGSMKELVGRWVEGRSEKQSGKAKMVYRSDDQDSSSSRMSESSG